MSKSKPLSEIKKKQIADIYNEGDLSIGAIAEDLGVSIRTVHNYKNYNDTKDPCSSIQTLEDHEGSIENNDDHVIDKTEDSIINNESNNIEEPKTINFVGGKKRRNFEEPLNEEFEHECAECSHEFNGKPSYCTNCGIELDWEEKSENEESLDLGKIALALGGIGVLVTVGYLINRAKNNNQGLSRSAWNN